MSMHLVLMLEVLFCNSVVGILRAYNIAKANNERNIYKIPCYICSKRGIFLQLKSQINTKTMVMYDKLFESI